jgi:hypothetical protein
MRILTLIAVTLALIGSPLARGQVYSPLYPPSSTQNLYAYCYYYDGSIVYNCTVAIGSGAYYNTNGHFHNTSRPYSTVSPTSGNTGGSGYVPVTLTTKIIGQAETAFACAYTCGYFDYAVGYGDIYWTDNAIFTLVGGNTTNHGDNTFNHWMMSDAAYAIYYTCGDYIAASGAASCVLNDMALPFGGKFDINQNWTSPHITHDRGRAVDINSVPPGNVAQFLGFCTAHGAVEALQEANGSLHCRF